MSFRLQKASSFRGNLRTLAQVRPASVSRPERPEQELPEAELGGASARIGQGVAPASVATKAPSPLASFDGLSFNENCGGIHCGAGHPPDTNGDVGPTYYIQTVNTAIGIYRKSDGVRVVGIDFDTFMRQGDFGNLCDTDNYGDPVVIYDTFADRWIITDFAFIVDSAGNTPPPYSYECFAVSQSGDPVSGGWDFYSLHVADYLQDYPKFGVWTDGLYMSANMFGFSHPFNYQYPRVWAMNKAQMYAGAASPQVVSFNVQPVESQTPQSLLPSNARLQVGTPPAGRPNLFVAAHAVTDRVRVWKFKVNWSTPSKSTFTGPSNSLTKSSWSSPAGKVPEKDGNDIDTLGYRLMMQNQYTNFGGVESLWASHTVHGSNLDQTAVRWYQVPVTKGVVGKAVQASTFNPDSRSRLQPSLAVDQAGDMAIGYSVSAGNMYPAIRYAGRLFTDPRNTLGQTETSLIEGTGAQTHIFSDGSTDERWGDYSAMTLDPDGCTFWYTTEYYASSGGDDHTRIGAFRFPSCVSASAPKALVTAKAGKGSGTVTSSPSGVNCGTTCSASFSSSVSVKLTAKAGAGSSFSGWHGDCSGKKACTVKMSANRSVTATFKKRR